MLGAEQRDELYTGSFGEKVDIAAALRVHTGMIGDQPDVLAAECREFLRFENVETGLDAGGAPGAFRECTRERPRRREQRE